MRRTIFRNVIISAVWRMFLFTEDVCRQS